MKQFTFLTLSLFIAIAGFAQKDTIDSKTLRKKGWSFGALPAVAYDTDVGFRYGALANIYHFGDGSRYPNYDHSIYLEWSRTTKGNGLNVLTYDSDRLIPGTRVTSELRYATERALDFYGFNGYEANYNPNFEDRDHPEHISRVFYRHERQVLRAKTDFQIDLMGPKLRALVGYTYMNTNIDTVDVSNINDGASDANLVPVGIGSLYQDYVESGIIEDKYKNGGANNLFKLGFVYDTRDLIANPTTGLWAEAFLLTDPGFTNESYGKLIVNWRQYFTLLPKRINFAYRVSLQPKLWGNIPWYMLPFSFNSFQDRDGLGGSKTLRGIIRNRVVGEGVAFANLEFRTVPYRAIIFRQNFYLGIVPYLDLGMVIQKRDVDYSLLSPRRNDAGDLINIQPTVEEETVHLAYGAELKLVLNDNFIVSVTYGLSSEADGGSGTYIGLNYLF